MSEQERIDRLRLGRPVPTSSARREKQALQPPDGRGRGRVGARDLLGLMLQGDRRHRRVHPRRWTRHRTNMSNIIKSRRIRSSIIKRSLDFSRVISIRRGMSITRGIMLSFTRGVSLSSLLSSSSMSSILSSILCNMQRLVWRMRIGAFQGGLTTCLFYRTSVNTWQPSFRTIKQ